MVSYTSLIVLLIFSVNESVMYYVTFQIFCQLFTLILGADNLVMIILVNGINSF